MRPAYHTHTARYELRRGASHTHIIILIDTSQSMEGAKARSVRSGAEEVLRRHAEGDGRATVTLATFSGGLTRIGPHAGVDLSVLIDAAEARDTTVSEPECGGMTPLHDAMARIIDREGRRMAAQAEADRPDEVVFICCTDGQENASTEETAETVRERVEHQRDVYSWSFMYAGANQDAVLSAGAMGDQPGQRDDVR